MTLSLKARDLLLAALLLFVGVFVGLAFNAAPSRAQSPDGASSYLQQNGQWYFCQQRQCHRVWFD